jgi:hypothetical protein
MKLNFSNGLMNSRKAENEPRTEAKWRVYDMDIIDIALLEQGTKHLRAAADNTFITIITSRKPLTKTFSINANGEVVKKPGGVMSEGHAETVTIKNAKNFCDLLVKLKPNQALCYGTAGHEEIKLITKRKFEEHGKPVGYIPRTREHFHFAKQPGIMMLDYDPAKESDVVLSPDELRGKLIEAAPALKDALLVMCESASSNIFNSETSEQINGIRGQRIYIFVQDASDIPRAGRALFNRLFQAGLGCYEVSKSGQLLERSIIDSSVWQPERLDFAAGAHCIAPLEQRRGKPHIIDGEVIDTSKALPDLTEDEQASLETIKYELKAEVQHEVEEATAAFIKKMAPQMASDNGKDTARRAVENQVLMGDYPLILENGQSVSVAQVLDDPGKYHSALTYDPLEPDYQNGKLVGKLYLIGGRPILHSFAHGSRTYKLLRQPRQLRHNNGDTFGTVQRVLDLAREMPDIFDYGDILVMVIDGKFVQLDEHRLAHYLGGIFQFYLLRQDKDGNNFPVFIDPPVPTIKQILALSNQRQLKKLKTVITAPVITPDGYIVNKPGYCTRTQLFLDNSEVPPLPDRVDDQMVKAAVERLLKPFETFPFVGKLDKSVFICSLITAILRPVLPTAPAFAFDAPIQGSGKSLLAACLSALSTSDNPSVASHAQGRDDEETRKRIFSYLLNGSRTLVWDNVVGVFDSASIAALLTSPVYSDRILGKNAVSTLPNRLLFLMTGNNLTLAGDLARRVLKVRIDPKTERPYAREFELDPLEHVKANRQQMAVDVITIVRGWYGSTEQMCSETAPGRMASFETWDDMVRQPVA